MFKVIKILNSGVNVPEPHIVTKTLSANFKRGIAFKLSGGKAVACSATEKPKYIALEEPAETQTRMLCHAVNENMLFETYINADPSALSVGDTVTIGMDSNNLPGCVTATTASGVATIVDLCGAKAAGDKVVVKFN